MKKIIVVLLSFILTLGIVSCTGEVTVTFDSRGGNKVASVTYTGSQKNDLPTPEREDAIFMGWYSDTKWNNKVKSFDEISGSTTLYARWAVYQEIALTQNNYNKYFDLSIRYLYSDYLFNKTDLYDICKLEYTPKDCFVKDGKEDGATTSFTFYVHGTQYTGRPAGNRWTRYKDGWTMGTTWSFSNLSEVEKTNGVAVYNISGTFRGYLLED